MSSEVRLRNANDETKVVDQTSKEDYAHIDRLIRFVGDGSRGNCECGKEFHQGREGGFAEAKCPV